MTDFIFWVLIAAAGLCGFGVGTSVGAARAKRHVLRLLAVAEQEALDADTRHAFNTIALWLRSYVRDI